MTLARIEVLLAALLFSTGGAAIKATSFSGWQVASFRAGVAAVTRSPRVRAVLPRCASAAPRSRA